MKFSFEVSMFVVPNGRNNEDDDTTKIRMMKSRKIDDQIPNKSMVFQMIVIKAVFAFIKFIKCYQI